MHPDNVFSYTNYDYLGRVVESGEYTESGANPYGFELQESAGSSTSSILGYLMKKISSLAANLVDDENVDQEHVS